MQSLERRDLMAVYTVDTIRDESDGNFTTGDFSIREAVQRANATPGTDTINFRPGLAGKQITLTRGNLVLSDDVAITGLGANRLTISGNDASRAFLINSADVTIRALKLTGGNATNTGGTLGDGGAILARGGANVILVSVWATDNQAARHGGAVAAINSRLDVIGSTFDHNIAAGSGGGVYFDGPAAAHVNDPALFMANVTLSTNDSLANTGRLEGGGGLFVADNHARLVNCTIAINDSVSLGGGVDTINSGRTSTTAVNTVIGNNRSAGVPNNLGEELAPGSAFNYIGAGGIKTILEFTVGPVPTHLPGARIIDRGNASLALSRDGTPLTFDARQVPRVTQGDLQRGAEQVDIGAVELHNPTIAVSGTVMFEFVEGDVPVPVFPTAVFADIDNTTFDDQRISFRKTDFQIGDHLIVRNAGDISVSGDMVLYQGIVVAQVIDFSTRISINFVSPVTADIVQEVIRNVSFESTADNPALGTRTIEIQNFGVSVNVEVSRSNINPTLSNISGTTTYDSANGSVRVAPSATISDNDAEFNRGVFRVSVANSQSAGNELFLQQPFRISTSGIVRLDNLEIGVATVNTKEEIQITLNANATLTVVQQLMRAVRFKTTDSATYSRQIEFSLTDGDGGTSNVATRTINII